MKKTVLVLAIISLVLVACDSIVETDSKMTINSMEVFPFCDIDLAENGITTIAWNGDSDKSFAAIIEAVQNNTRKNASGIKITSNAHSDDFPGIYFIWDSKQKDSGYLKVSGGIFSILESFVVTSKEANIYWDFNITLQEGQHMTDDGCYVFYIPKVNNNKNINMVFLSEWVKKETMTPPIVNPSDNATTVSVSIDYEPNSWVADVLVMLTLSEGAWDNFFLWPDYGNMSNSNMVAEKAAILEWITLDFSDALKDYNPVLLFVGGGYDYFDIRTAPLDHSINRISINPKVLTFRFSHGYPHIALAISREAAESQFGRFHLPLTVTLNEKKMDEIKKYTDVTGNFTIGTKFAVLNDIEIHPEDVDPPKDDPKIDDMEKINIPFQIGIIDNSMSSRQNHNLFTIVRSKEELDEATSGRFHQYWTDTGGPFNVYYLKNFTEKYDNDFFVNNALILCLFTGGSGGMKMDVTDIQRQGSELTIFANINWGMLTVGTYSTVVIEVTKYDVYGVTTLVKNSKCM
jgi:hypothetical protein